MMMCVSRVPLTGTPPSYAGGSHVTQADSSPTDVHLTFSGELGTSGGAGYSWKWKERKDEAERNERRHEYSKYSNSI